MTVTVDVGDLDIRVTAQPLTQEAFAPFGDVITNPRPDLHPAAAAASPLPPNAISANQGSAIQYRDVSRIRDLYSQAPSGRSIPKMSMFVCAARKLLPADKASEGRFRVGIMERHPFTTQTFTPITSSASRYLVIVAPSLAPGVQDEGLPVPTAGHGLPGRGLPDARGLRAYVAESNQAVTYGAGTWHSPMVTLGEQGTALDFVVFQFASGEGIEDCQLVEFRSAGSREPRIDVVIPGQMLSPKL
ncbi:Ureidoglycolate lyase-like protein [Hapsidospora chrysogenum ATCC 11550]|uniref:Ureidoglycolate lyase-like protein n=1 Tax=Hapsidospora chrysogenum (strain ATCC 11550 / CBS 779.69 / DSM 880 / IAM 14645 / JCM 23072 / IMI 49137) TaxID=857340 RepID=A0A086T5U1_HAPC1|nr:Ureidoglycolate lyase-like protein [Hapsidospora chrysogenum ATCC 11550]